MKWLPYAFERSPVTKQSRVKPVEGQTSSSSVASGTNVFQIPTVPSQPSVPSLRDFTISSRLYL